MTAQSQLQLFGEHCWGDEQKISWQVLEREERARNTPEALAYIEAYAGTLPAETLLIPVQVLFVPGTNFFLMPLLEDE